MESFEQNPKFLKERFPGLATSPEVKQAARRTEHRTGKTPQHIAAENAAEGENIDAKEADIQNYLNRFKEIIDRDDPKEKERGTNALKKNLIDKYVIRVEDIPESYWQAQMRVARNRGEAGDWQHLAEEDVLKIKQDHLAQTKEDQKGSLEEWIGYLASERSAKLPDYLKYWAFQGMLRLERYEKGNKEKGLPGRFPERPSGKQRSVKMFPEVNERGLEFIAEAYKAQAKSESIEYGRYDIDSSAKAELLTALAKKDFRAIYGWAQEYIPPISQEEMQTTDGEWVVFSQDSDPKKLTDTLQGKGSGWCIAGEQLAGQYLGRGNLNIYYTRDRNGEFSIPRVVIVQKENSVTEVRGIEWEEDIDDYIKETDIIGRRLKELHGGETFTETNQDTKQLTAIDHKISGGVELTQDELVFLYEIEKPIKYFGRRQDPRVAELRESRNSAEEDMLIIFECTRDQIARAPKEINESTKAYVGQLEPGIFQRLPENFEHVYTSFPEKIRREKIFHGGRSEDQLVSAVEAVGNTSRYVKPMMMMMMMMMSKEFIKSLYHNTDAPREQWVLKTPEEMTLIILSVADLGFNSSATTRQIIGSFDERGESNRDGKIHELGLELCPADTGPNLCLKYRNQPFNELMYIGMKQINFADSYSDSGASPYIFRLAHFDDGLWLIGEKAKPHFEWYPDNKFVCRLRKSES